MRSTADGSALDGVSLAAFRIPTKLVNQGKNNTNYLEIAYGEFKVHSCLMPIANQRFYSVWPTAAAANPDGQDAVSCSFDPIWHMVASRSLCT